nr:Verru/Chthon cassette protein A [Verrucomicrobiota bacterium]
PWRTLVFTPQPLAGKLHPGHPENPVNFPNKQVPDHYLLDLFTMPVVEPYALSEPLSSAGKVNLNYRIAPFDYIQRKTALYGILKSTWLCAITKASTGTGVLRVPVSGEETLRRMDSWLDAPERSGVFRSASEICEIHLVPENVRAEDIEGWWNSPGDNTASATDLDRTGDDAREYPYGHVYARTTTKSNTYTVYLHVQTLHQVSGREDYRIWDERKDKVTGEYRGSTTIERYIDTSDPDLAEKNFATDLTQSLDRHYKFRVVATRRFAP